MSRIVAVAFLLLSVSLTCAQETPTEADYYPITRFETPEGVVLEASGFQLMPDGKMAVCSRRGEIWMINDPMAKEVKASQFKRFAHGLHETLTLAERDGWLYLTQRTDVSRIRDTDVAQAAADYTASQVLQQASIGVLAQANQNGAAALKLL